MHGDMRDSRRVDHQALTQGAFSGAMAFAKAAPLVVLDTVILAAIVDLSRRLMLPTGSASPYVIGTLEAILNVFVFAPMMIAAHRYSIAGMVTPRLTGSLAGPIFGRFVKASLILSLITVAGYGGGAFFSEALGPPLGTAVFFMAFAATIALAVRFGPLFPAISVNAEGARWGAAWRDTSGHGWPIFFVLALCSLPFIFLGLPLEAAMREVEPLRVAGLILTLIRAMIETGWTLVLACAAGLIYKALARELLLAPPSGSASGGNDG
jgi:hypothetical protein